jgi:uncharacterized surface protein with fasciclin (FAS1) repeats
MRLSRKIVGVVAGASLVLGSALVAAPSASAGSTTGGQKIIDALLPGYQANGDGNPYDFDIVTTAVIATGLAPVLGSLDNVTVFAPNDRAFEVLAVKTGALPASYRYGAKVNETQIVNALVDKLGLATIKKVVLYHVFTGGALAGADVVKLPTFGTKIKMANGQTLRVTNLTRLTGKPTIILGDKDGSFFNDYVVRSKVDAVKVPGGVVHGISDVLLPTL